MARYRYYFRPVYYGAGGGCCSLLIFGLIALSLGMHFMNDVDHRLNPSLGVQESATTQATETTIFQVIQSYYQAAEKQDYSTAYAYIDPRNIPFLNKLCYIEGQIAQDQTMGKVIDFTIVSVKAPASGDVFPSNTSIWTFSIQVSRKLQMDEVTLYFQKEGECWMIVDTRPYLC